MGKTTPYDGQIATLSVQHLSESKQELYNYLVSEQSGYRRALADQAAAVPAEAQLSEDELEAVVFSLSSPGPDYYQRLADAVNVAATAHALRYAEAKYVAVVKVGTVLNIIIAVREEHEKSYSDEFIAEALQDWATALAALPESELAAKFWADPAFVEVTKQGMEDLGSGNFVTLEDLRKEVKAEGE